MRYPFLPAIGRYSPDAGPTWRMAGHNLQMACDLAAARVADSRDDFWAWAEWYEAARRRGAMGDARRILSELGSRATETPARAVHALAIAYFHWWTPPALEHYRVVERLGRESGEALCLGLGLLGQARCSRFSARSLRTDLVDEALELFSGDVCASADAWRERAAHALLRDDHDGAVADARRALGVHVDHGDQVLSAYATLLIGRVDRDHADDRTATLRTALDLAEGSGALDVAADVALYLAPALARGKTAESADWHEAIEMVQRTAEFKRGHDAFAEAECWIQLSNLYVLGDVAKAEQLARRALDYFRAIDNMVGLGSAWTALGRCAFRRSGVVWQGSWVRGGTRASKEIARGVAYYTRAQRSYTRAKLSRAAGRISAERALIRSYELGIPIDQASMEALRSGVDPADHLTTVKVDLLRALAAMQKRPRLAAEMFEKALVDADRLGTGNLVAVAAAGLAAAHQRARQPAAAACAAHRFIDAAEAIRLSITSPDAALDLAALAVEPYRFALGVAQEANDARLALRVLERVRGERLAALFRRRSAVEVPHEVARIVQALADVDRAINDASRPASGDGAVRSSRSYRAAMYGTAECTADDLERRRAALVGQLTDATNAYFASIYAPEALDLDSVESSLDTGEIVVVLEPILVDGVLDIVSVSRLPGQDWHLATTRVSGPGRDVLGRLSAVDGQSAVDVTVGELSHLVDVLPASVRLALNTGEHHRIRIVPAGELWAVPFLALPFDRSSVVPVAARATVVLSPSLRIHAMAQHEPRVGRGIIGWLSREMDRVRGELGPLISAPEGFEVTAEPDEFLDRLHRGGARVAVLTAHGNANPGLAHALTLDAQPKVTAADLLAVPALPPVVSFAACHGLHAGADAAEPLGLTIASLCAGAREVIAAHAELGMGAETTVAISRIYRSLALGSTAAEAVANTLATLLILNPDGGTIVTDWAALNVAAIGEPCATSAL